jgi:hypothetical protein
MHNQSGNVFILILVGIVLFAALSFTISRAMRSETTDKLSGQKAALAATDILNYAQKLEQGINKLRQKNISENDISFESPQDMAYAHTPVVTADKQLFNLSGGAVNWQNPPPNVNDGSAWLFTGETCLADLGTGATGCDTDTDTSNEELIAVLPNLVTSVCTEINNRLNLAATPADTGGGASTAKFTGTFDDDKEIILAGGPLETACFSRGGNNFFYTVLLAR